MSNFQTMWASYWTLLSILFLNRKVNVDDRRTSKAYLSKTKNDYCSKVKRGTWPLVIPIQLDVILSTRPSSLRKFVWPANSGKNSRTEVSQNWKQQQHQQHPQNFVFRCLSLADAPHIVLIHSSKCINWEFHLLVKEFRFFFLVLTEGELVLERGQMGNAREAHCHTDCRR